MEQRHAQRLAHATFVLGRRLRELVPARRRSMRGARRLLKEGPGSWWRARRRHQALVDLAFAKWHASREGREGPDPTVVALRERLRRMAGA